MRLEHEKNPEDLGRLDKKDDPYFGKKQDLAFAVFAYYMCY